MLRDALPALNPQVQPHQNQPQRSGDERQGQGEQLERERPPGGHLHDDLGQAEQGVAKPGRPGQRAVEHGGQRRAVHPRRAGELGYPTAINVHAAAKKDVGSRQRPDGSGRPRADQAPYGFPGSAACSSNIHPTKARLGLLIMMTPTVMTMIGIMAGCGRKTG